MPDAAVNTQRKSANGLLFEHYLRTGQRLNGAEAKEFVEIKYNHNHDPEDGRFTFATGGGSRPLGAKPTVHPTLSKPSVVAPARSSVPTKPLASKHPTGLPPDWRPNGGRKPLEVERRANNAMGQYRYNRERGMSEHDAAAWAANSEIESRGDSGAVQEGGGPGRGLFQLGSNVPTMDRRADFRRIMGVPIETATLDQQHRFREWELVSTEKAARRRIDSAVGAGAKASAISRHFLRPRERETEAIDRANIAEAIMRRVQAARKLKRRRSTQVLIPMLY